MVPCSLPVAYSSVERFLFLVLGSGTPRRAKLIAPASASVRPQVCASIRAVTITRAVAFGPSLLLCVLKVLMVTVMEHGAGLRGEALLLRRM